MRASTANAILAFCASSSVGAPAPAPVNSPLDPGFSLRCLDSPDLSCPPPGEDEFGQPQIVGKRATQILPFVAGARMGSAVWKVFNLFDKRDAFWDFSKINPNDDSPLNPFDDEGLPGMRDVAGGEEPLEKRQFTLGLRIGAALGKELLFGDDDKKKRDALVDDIPVVEDLPVLGDLLEQLDAILEKIPVVGNIDDILAKLSVVGDLPVVGDIVKDDAASEKTKRDALVDIGLPGIGDLKNLPFVGDLENLPVVGDVLDGQDEKVKRSFVDKIRDFLNRIGADPTDDDPMNPFDDPGLPGKRAAKAFTA